MAGPWCIFKMLGKRSASSGSASPPERGHRPAAVLPGTGRDAAFRLHKEAGPGGFAVETGNGVEPAGTLAFFDERLIEALANVLEAAGPLTPERAGALLDERALVPG